MPRQRRSDALSEIDTRERAMLELLWWAVGVPRDPNSSRLASSALVAYIAKFHQGVSDQVKLFRGAARMLRDECIAHGASPSRYETDGWRVLEL